MNCYLPLSVESPSLHDLGVDNRSKMPTLEEINKRLFELIEEISQAGDDYAQMNFDLEGRKSEMLLSAELGRFTNQAMRDAQVRIMIENEGLARPVIEKKSQWLKLCNERDLLFEISRNLRTILGSK